MATNMSRDDEREKEKERAVLQWRQKTEAAKKGEILREVQKLKVQIQAMEREKCTHLYSKRNDFRQDFLQLEEMDTKATSERKTEQVKLKQQLERISHMVKRFHRELRDVKPTPEFVERLKTIMEDIEGTINQFKEQQRSQYEEILIEERTTWLEIQALEKKFDAWSQLPGNNSSLSARTGAAQKPLTSARDITKDLPPEVAAFEKFVEQNGGVRGGWDEYDHQTFLKWRQRYQAKPGFIQHLLPSLPTRTEEEIALHEEWFQIMKMHNIYLGTRAKPGFIQHLLPSLPTRTEEEIALHEEWFQEYLFLNDTKKDAIKKWRERKNEEKEDLLTKATDPGGEEEKPDEKQARLREQTEKERRERKAGLNAYKVQKELEKAEQEERKLRAELDKHQKQKEWSHRQQEMRARVMERKKEREEEEEFLRQQRLGEEEEERDRQRQISAREIARFRERDRTAIQYKIAKEKHKETEEKEKEQRLQRLKGQVEVDVPRDPNRLLKPTAGWKNRKKDTSSSGGQVLHMPHRAVPSWRAGP